MKEESLATELPGGTVTFLFTDIEGSTELLKQLGEGYSTLLADQRNILRDVFSRWNGTEVDTQGDSFFISFSRATEAVNACVEAQRALAEHTWPEEVEVRVRMGLHTGEPWRGEEGYVGMDVHRAARIAQIGHGGQVLLSETTTSLIRGELPEGVGLQDLGSHVLKDISQPEQIHQLTLVGFLSDFPPLTSLESRPNNLPVQPTPFVGRLDELEALDALISDPHNRLVSIVGAGGMGKTRLAIAAAEQQLYTMVSSDGKEEPRFPDGAFFVGLAPLESTEAMIPTIGKGIGLQFYEGADPKKQILDYFRRKRMLLLMDNFEHLKSGAGLLTEIIQAAPEVKILVTSREKLNLRSEIPYILRGMRYPEEEEVGVADERFSAVALFHERTRRIHPKFVPDEEQLKSIGRICRLVEGMPLGVELAAAWMEMLTPGEIATEIQQSLDFLEAEVGDAPERHQSIRAVFDSTWNMLSESEQDILKKLSVFRGGFTTEAASHVARASKRQLLGLVNKSLLLRSSTDRLGIHELLRQYVAEELEKNQAETEKVGDLHCEFFADFVHQREAEIDAGDTRQALDEMDNIRTAWQWAVSRKNISAIRKHLHGFHMLHTFQGWYHEAESTFTWAARVVSQKESVGDRGIAHGTILAYLGFFSYRVGKQKAGLEFLQEGQAILRQLNAKPELAIANCYFGYYCLPKDQAEAKESLLKSLKSFQERDNSWIKAYILNSIGVITLRQGETIESKNYFRKGLQIGEALNNRRVMAWSSAGLGWLALHEGKYQKAVEHFKYGQATYQAIGYVQGSADGLSTLGYALNLASKYEEAKDCLLEALATFQDYGYQEGSGETLWNLGDVAFAMGNYEKAKDYYAKTLALFKKLEDPRIGFILCNLAKVAVAIGDEKEAQSKIHDTLELGLRNQDASLSVAILASMSSMLVWKDEMERAVEFASLAEYHPRSDPKTRKEAKQQLSQLKNLLPPDEFITAQELGRKLNPLDVIEVLYNEWEHRGEDVDK